jgi:2'-5' RNA ligase
MEATTTTTTTVVVETVSTVSQITTEQLPPPKPKEPSPNYFFALHVDDPATIQNLQNLRMEFCKRLESNDVDSFKKHFERYFVNDHSFHITLGVMHIPTPESLAQVCTWFENELPQLIQRSELPSMQPKLVSPLSTTADIAAGAPRLSTMVDFQGLSSFSRGRVIYIPPVQTDLVSDIAKVVCNSFREAFPTFMKEEPKYTPHLTFYKAPGWKIHSRLKGELFADLASASFGSQTIDSIGLYAMGPTENGYRRHALCKL